MIKERLHDPVFQKNYLKMIKKIILAGLGLIVVFLLWAIASSPQKITQSEKLSQLAGNITITNSQPEIVFPIAEFKKRITKKPFGIYITPQNSPIQPERFSGYHTGVDVEYGDVDGEVPVFAISDGQIVLAKWVSGYGNTLVLKTTIEKEILFVVYGHLDQQSFSQNVQVKRGEKIGILGESKTQATDFERKHLHLAIVKNKLDLAGYVKTKEELNQWYDLLDFFKKNDSLELLLTRD